jgi:hypothetical protein
LIDIGFARIGHHHCHPVKEKKSKDALMVHVRNLDLILSELEINVKVNHRFYSDINSRMKRINKIAIKNQRLNYSAK